MSFCYPENIFLSKEFSFRSRSWNLDWRRSEDSLVRNTFWIFYNIMNAYEVAFRPNTKLHLRQYIILQNKRKSFTSDASVTEYISFDDAGTRPKINPANRLRSSEMRNVDVYFILPTDAESKICVSRPRN